MNKLLYEVIAGMMFFTFLAGLGAAMRLAVNKILDDDTNKWMAKWEEKA